MEDINKRNILYFEGDSMREIYTRMEDWQAENKKRFLSISIQIDNNKFCCIALTNPTEAAITNRNGTEYVGIYGGDKLNVATF